MTTAEIVAYLVGADLAARGSPAGRFLAMPAKYASQLLSPQELEAREKLGGDMWGHWVMRGYMEAMKV